MAIGDVNSNERGSGARFNEGKDPMELVPVSFWKFAWCFHDAMTEDMRDVLEHLSDIQTRKVLGSFDWRPGQLEMAMHVLAYGAEKYAPNNWTKGQPWSVPIGCALRHIRSILDGEEIDPESGEPHMGHVYCNVLFLDWFRRYYPEGDDLIPPEAFPNVQ